MNKPSSEEILIDVVLLDQDEDLSATVPESVVLNAIAIGRELSLHPVKELSYHYRSQAYISICKNSGLSIEQGVVLKELVELNSGYITPALLRSHLPFGFAACAHLAEDLITQKQAAACPTGRTLYLLPNEKRGGGWSEE